MQKTFKVWTKVFFIVLVALIPTLIITVYSALSFQKASITEKALSLTNLCEGFLNEQRLIVRSARDILTAISLTETVQEEKYGLLSSYFVDLMNLYPDYAVFLATDSSGLVVSSGVNKTGYSLADRDYLIRALSTNEFSMSSFLFSRSTGLPAIVFSLPVTSKTGTVSVLVATYALERYGKELSLTRLSDSKIILEVFDRYGQRLFTNSKNPLDVLGHPVSLDLFSLAKKHNNTASFVASLENSKYLVSVGSLNYNDQEMYITLRTSYPDVLLEAGFPVVQVLLLMFVACFAAFALSLQLARRLLVDRIERLTEFVENLAEGDFGVRSGMNTAHDEITDLMIAFNHMAAVLEERTNQADDILAEKEILLVELQKRVSDNLQLLSSIVSLQIDYASDSGIKRALMTTHSRIMALSMVYETIYRYTDIEKVSIKEYCTGLCDFLVSLYSDIGTYVVCTVSGIDVNVRIERALPIALIVNELVSNALLHAFRPEKDGFISITFSNMNEGLIQMTIEDNGVGMESSIEQTETLGFEMIQALVSQINGSIVVEGSAEGTLIRVFFPQDIPIDFNKIKKPDMAPFLVR
ncbi:MAG TPA: histidine kinase dimerization/phosphoacceptor domain -containing protein [Treponemataceae bacterium]|nr:histidine kinase dimerization/phosphoacceptor domain -containing protein [Treponemataceae bacterium]